MKLGVRGKLFLVSVVLIVAGGGAAGWWAQRELGTYLENQARTELERHARSAAATVSLDTDPDRLADRIGEATGARITIIDVDGRVIGDSEFDGLALRELESHARRPEVVEARRDGVGVTNRYSRSVETDMLYVAVADPAQPTTPVVRASRRLSTVQAALARVRWILGGAGLLLLVVAVVMSALASWIMVQAVNRLLAAAKAVSRDRTARIDVETVGDFRELAENVNRVLDQLEGTMGALSSQNERMEAVLQGMNEPVLGLDAELTIILCNRAAREFLGLHEAPVGTPLREVLKAPEFDKLDFAGSPESPSSIELELGNQRLLAQATPQRDGSGSVLVLHDITGIRRLEKMRRDFVANVSHELRTPVAVLQANAETLLDGALEDFAMAEKLVEAIHRQTERLSNLVADLLDISRIEAGQYHLDLEVVPVRELCTRTLESMERPADARSSELHLELSGDLAVVADPKAVEQIVTNLLDNAIKYSGSGGSVTLRASTFGNRVRFEVEDDGPGIERKHHARLFERFYRVDKGRSRGMGGTGLGLSIVKHLVESMDGRVGYRPADPRGSVFWFELPKTELEESETVRRSVAMGAMEAL